MRWSGVAVMLCAGFMCLSFAKISERVRPAPPLFEQIDRIAASAGLGLQTVSLTGLNVTSDDEVFAALGLENTHTLLGFDANGARERLEVLPWVRDVQIKQTFPHRLDISIQEHQPYALWTSEDGEIVVNHDGRRLAVVGAGAVRDLPHIEGKGAPQAAQALFRHLEKYSELSPLDLRAVRVSERRWTLVLQDRRHILLPEEHYGHALEALMSGRKGKRLIDRSFAVIDFRNPGKVILRPQHSLHRSGHRSGPASTTSHRSTHRKHVLRG